MDFIAEKLGSIDYVGPAALLGFAVAQRQPAYTGPLPGIPDIHSKQRRIRYEGKSIEFGG